MNKQIRVWDPLVRIFHWSLVITFFVSYFTGEDESQLHIYSGYTVLGLIIFRIIWGLVGSKYSRFSDFLCSPKKAITYIKSLLSQRPQRYTGHNPAGAWMIIFLLLSIFTITISGLKIYAIEEGAGPLSGNSSEISIMSNAYADSYKPNEQHDEYSEEKQQGEEEEEFWEDLHEASANLTLFLIFLHILGVFVSGKIHKENLIKAMITGKKKV